MRDVEGAVPYGADQRLSSDTLSFCKDIPLPGSLRAFNLSNLRTGCTTDSKKAVSKDTVFCCFSSFASIGLSPW